MNQTHTAPPAPPAPPAPRAPAAVPEELRRLSEAVDVAEAAFLRGRGSIFEVSVARKALEIAAAPATPPVSSAGGEEALWDAVHEAAICAWNLLDGTQDDASGVNQADWDALSAAMNAMAALVPEEEQPFSPSYAVAYLRKLAAAPAAPPVDGGTAEDRDDVLFAFHRYVDNPTPFEVTWWTRHFPQFAQDIREHAVEVIDMNFRAANPNPDWAEQVARRVCDEHDVGSATFDVAEALRNAEATGYTRGCTTRPVSRAPIASFIARDCACCSDQPTVPPDCPACHGTGGFTRYQIANGMIAKVPPTLSSRTPAGAAGDPVENARFVSGYLNDMALRGERPSVVEPRTTLPPVPDGHTMEVKTALASARPASPAPAASAGGASSFGWLFHNPDTGVEWSANHPVESGECEDATDIRPATLEHLYDEMIGAWALLAEYRDQRERAALAPAAQVNPGREEIARIILAKWDALLGPANDHGTIGGIPGAWRRSELCDQFADAILAARPVAENDAGETR